jgi:hypothetical protein
MREMRNMYTGLSENQNGRRGEYTTDRHTYNTACMCKLFVMLGKRNTENDLVTAFKAPYPSNNENRKHKSGTALELLRLEGSLWCIISAFQYRLHMCIK